MRVACLLLLLLGGHPVHAACEIEPGHSLPKLSTAAARVRDAFYIAECARAGGTLIDSTDPTLKGRLQPPHGMILPKRRAEFALFGGIGIHYGSQPNLDELPPVILAFVLDARSSVQNVMVLEGSGNKRYDAAVVEFLRHVRWKTPATLDGTPIPVLAYFRYSIKIYGPD